MGQFSERRPERVNLEKGDCGGYPAYGDDAQRWPTLTEFLGCVRYLGGEPRETGSILLFVDDDQLKVMFKEPNEGRVGFAKVEDLAGLLEALEGMLEGQRIDWRRDKNKRRGYR
jgi:hypothetical protein